MDVVAVFEKCVSARRVLLASPLPPGLHIKTEQSLLCCKAYSCLMLALKLGESSRQRDIPNFHILVTPLIEQLDRSDLLGHLLGQDLVSVGGLHLDFAVIRHVGQMADAGFS